MMANRQGSKAWTENRLSSRLGLQYPIIQGPLGGLSSQRLTAVVSNYGGLGSFGAHSLKPEAIRNVIREIKGLMDAQGEERPMEQQAYRTVTVDGVSIFCREAGPKGAPTLLLLRGLPSSSRMFQPLLTRVGFLARLAILCAIAVIKSLKPSRFNEMVLSVQCSLVRKS
jgi:NAD(P)H-dependent flavin oxidoreductase YrpB (nitropropane dioxygenase family)